jgi:DNA replication and repair protein RecF
MVRMGQPGYRISVAAEGRQGTLELDLVWRRDQSKRLQLNGAPLERITDALGRLPVVTFSPGELELVQGGPVGRRRYLDLLLCQLFPVYYDRWLTYHRVLGQRNRLLSLWRGDPPPGERQVWDDSLVESGLPLAAHRQVLAAQLAEVLPALHARLTGAAESLSVQYQPGVPGPRASPGNAGEWRAAFQQQLIRSRPLERRRRLTLIGPHRDDLAIVWQGRNLRTFASQGQQRLIALALKLGEVELLRREGGEEPVLLLDDVLSELDGARRAALLDFLAEGGQTLITATAVDAALGADASVRFYQVEAGQVR